MSSSAPSHSSSRGDHDRGGRGSGGPPRGGGGRGGRGGHGGLGGGGPEPPSHFTSRIPWDVISNTFQITSLPRVPYHQFEVSIEPASPAKKAPVMTAKKARLIIDALHKSFASTFAEGGVYDGKSLYFSRINPLNQGQPTEQFPVVLQPGPLGQPGGDFSVTLTLVKVISPIGSGVRGNAALDPVNVNLLQMLVQEHARRESIYFRPRRSAFFPNEQAISLKGGIRLLHGYFQSVRPVTNQVVLNVDTASTLMYESMPLHDWAIAFLKEKFSDPHIGGRELAKLTENDAPFKELKQALRFVRVTYRSDRLRERKIRGLVPRAGRYEFRIDNGTLTTVQEHFASRGINIQYPDFFGAFLDEKKKVVVPAELCQIVAGQRYMRLLTKGQQQETLSALTISPDRRLQIIRRAQQFFAHSLSQFLINANMAVGTDPIPINGILLPPPRVGWRDSQKRMQDARVSKGQWKIDSSSQFIEPISIASWAVVSFSHGRDNQKILGVVESIRQCCQSRGMNMPGPMESNGIFNLREFNPNSLQEHVLPRLDSTRPAVVLFFLPDPGASSLHQMAKFWGDKAIGVTTQCMMISKVKANPLFGNNIALKLNAKLGGVNCISMNPQLESLRNSVTMVIGADVAHPGPGIVTRPSLASVVMSFNDNWTKYRCYMDVQAPRLEYIENLERMMQLGLEDFGDTNRRLPERLIFYRDGISEGQYDGIATAESEAIRKAWNNIVAKKGITKPPPFRLTFIIVEKRHHMRFLPNVAQQTKDNVPPGLLVSDAVVSRVYENFYLVSQAGILGTSRPTHYVVRSRDASISLEQCQELSYFLCHVNARTTRSVALPAPVNYADLLCREGFNYIRPGHDIFSSDNATTASGGSRNEDYFNIAAWRAVFPSGRVVNDRMYGKLFFL